MLFKIVFVLVRAAVSLPVNRTYYLYNKKDNTRDSILNKFKIIIVTILKANTNNYQFKYINRFLKFVDHIFPMEVVSYRSSRVDHYM